MAGKKVVLFGTGDFARVASVYLTKDSPHAVVAFTVHEAFLKAPTLLGKPVVPFERVQELYPPDEHAMFVAMGFSKINKARAEIYDACKAKGYQLISYINSKAVHWGEIEYGDNCFVFDKLLEKRIEFVGPGTQVEKLPVQACECRSVRSIELHVEEIKEFQKLCFRHIAAALGHVEDDCGNQFRQNRVHC